MCFPNTCGLLFNLYAYHEVQEKLAMQAQVKHALKFWVHREMSKAFSNFVEVGCLYTSFQS